MSIEIHIRGWSRYAQALGMLDTPGKMPGVRQATEKRDTNGVRIAEIEINRNQVKNVGRWLETREELKKFGIVVEARTDAKITGNVQGLPE